MKQVFSLSDKLNVSQLSDIAKEAKEISDNVHAPALPISKEVAITQSTNDPMDAILYADAKNVSPGTTEDLPVNKSGDNYFPINLGLDGLGQPAPATTATLTEEEKRKRTIIIASIILLVLIVLVSIYALKKGK